MTANFDMLTLTFSSIGSGVTGTGYTSIGNGWYRIWVIGTTVASPAANINAVNYTVSTAQEIAFWGNQVDIASSLRTYIPTAGSTLTALNLSAITGLSGDALGNSGITFTTTAAQTLTGTGTINWSTAANWTSRVPLPQDDVTINYAGASATTLTADMPRLGRNIDFTGFTKTLSVASTANTLFGNIALSTGMTITGGGSTIYLYLEGRGAQTITSATNNFSQTVYVASYGGSYTLQDNFSCSGAIGNHPNGGGTFNANNFNVSASWVSFTNAGTIVNMGSGTWTVSNTGSTNPWSVSATPTINANTSTVKISGSITTTATFAGGGKTYNNLYWSSTTSTGTLIITGANTFTSLQSDNTTARTWQFPNGVTQTIQPGGWQINGKSGAVTSITSDSAGHPATISCASGNVFASYLSLKDSAATGGAKFWATSSTDVSGNSGWGISTSPLLNASAAETLGVLNSNGAVAVAASSSAAVTLAGCTCVASVAETAGVSDGTTLAAVTATAAVHAAIGASFAQTLQAAVVSAAVTEPASVSDSETLAGATCVALAQITDAAHCTPTLADVTAAVEAVGVIVNVRDYTPLDDLIAAIEAGVPVSALSEIILDAVRAVVGTGVTVADLLSSALDAASAAAAISVIIDGAIVGTLEFATAEATLINLGFPKHLAHRIIGRGKSPVTIIGRGKSPVSLVGKP